MSIRSFFRHLFADNDDRPNSEPIPKPRKGPQISGAIGFGRAWSFNDFESPQPDSEESYPADREVERTRKHSDD